MILLSLVLLVFMFLLSFYRLAWPGAFLMEEVEFGFVDFFFFFFFFVFSGFDFD
jgi:hypothetical protein